MGDTSNSAIAGKELTGTIVPLNITALLVVYPPFIYPCVTNLPYMRSVSDLWGTSCYRPGLTYEILDAIRRTSKDVSFAMIGQNITRLIQESVEYIQNGTVDTTSMLMTMTENRHQMFEFSPSLMSYYQAYLLRKRLLPMNSSSAKEFDTELVSIFGLIMTTYITGLILNEVRKSHTTGQITRNAQAPLRYGVTMTSFLAIVLLILCHKAMRGKINAQLLNTMFFVKRVPINSFDQLVDGLGTGDFQLLTDDANESCVDYLSLSIRMRSNKLDKTFEPLSPIVESDSTELLARMKHGPESSPVACLPDYTVSERLSEINSDDVGHFAEDGRTRAQRKQGLVFRKRWPLYKNVSRLLSYLIESGVMSVIAGKYERYGEVPKRSIVHYPIQISGFSVYIRIYLWLMVPCCLLVILEYTLWQGPRLRLLYRKMKSKEHNLFRLQKTEFSEWNVRKVMEYITNRNFHKASTCNTQIRGKRGTTTATI